MGSTKTRTAALLLAGMALAAAPAFAQRDGRRDGDGDRNQRAERARPRAESDGRRGDRRNPPRERSAYRDRDERERRAVPRSRADAYRGYDNRRDDNRRYDNRRYDYRRYDGWSNRDRGYVYRPYRNRNYVIPYGYRPYGYRPGWSLDLYFGRPYGAAYPSAGYGYYSLAPGRPYGALRIVDAPPDAQVYVDDYYAGVVDDYDGVFQHLNLEAGPHRVEVEVPGYPPVSFDVRIQPGRTLTYRVNLP